MDFIQQSFSDVGRMDVLYLLDLQNLYPSRYKFLKPAPFNPITNVK